MNKDTIARMRRIATVLNRVAILLTLVAGAVEVWESSGA